MRGIVFIVLMLGSMLGFANSAHACRNSGMVVTGVGVFSSCEEMRRFLDKQIAELRKKEQERIARGVQQRYEAQQRQTALWQRDVNNSIAAKRFDIGWGTAGFVAMKYGEKYAMDKLKTSIANSLAKGAGNMSPQDVKLLKAIAGKITAVGKLGVQGALNPDSIQAMDAAKAAVKANLALLGSVSPHMKIVSEAVSHGDILIQTGFKIANDKVDLNYLATEKKLADDLAQKMYWDAPVTKLAMLDATEAQLREELGYNQIDYNDRFGGVLVMVEAAESGTKMDDVSNDVLKLIKN